MAIDVEMRTKLSTDALDRYQSSAHAGRSCRYPIVSAILSRSCEVRHVGNSRASSKNGGGNILALESILYISDRRTCSSSVLSALEATGCEVVGTDSATQAIALLYIMHSVALVVLHHRARERASFDLVRSLRAIRPGVPIILLCREQIGPLPSGVDASGVYLYDIGQPREKLTSQVQYLLTAEGPCPDVDDPVHCGAA
jgi:CheY-like chemotaxis protein